MSGDCGHMGTRGDGVASEEEMSGAGPMAGPSVVCRPFPEVRR